MSIVITTDEKTRERNRRFLNICYKRMGKYFNCFPDQSSVENVIRENYEINLYRHPDCVIYQVVGKALEVSDNDKSWHTKSEFNKYIEQALKSNWFTKKET